MDKKKILIACIALGVLLVGTMVWFFVSENSGKGGNPSESSVTATLPDGEVQRMTDSKSEAFRGRVSTDDYFDQLGARQADDEDISLVSAPINGKMAAKLPWPGPLEVRHRLLHRSRLRPLAGLPEAVDLHPVR